MLLTLGTKPEVVRKIPVMAKDTRLFDIIVLAGMVVNIILAVFLLIYYFNLL